jgi:hypothetical protein
MSISTRWIGTAVVAAMSLLAVAPQADAQVNPLFQVPFGVNPYFRVRPGLTLAQAYANTIAMGNAYQSIPPYALGYNPYYVPPVYYNPYGPFYGGGGYGGGGYNPYAAYANPYTPGAGYGGYGGYGANPYTPGGYDNGAAYNPYTPYSYDPYGLYGAAAVINAQGQMMLNQERARVLRNQAIQSNLETRKKSLETELWLKANTPTYTDEQAKIAKTILKRIQTNATPGEIAAGTALNVLLSDLAKHVGVKTEMGNLPLDEEALRHLNVTRSGVGDLGLLRNEGRFTWPKALRDLAKPSEQKEIEAQAQNVVSQGANGKVDENLLSDLKANVTKLRRELTDKVNDFSTAQYIEGKRFLNNFEEALLALEKGDAVAYFNFQKAAGGFKNVQELAKYMIDHGLRFAPAVEGDEAAYQALHTALATYDVGVNTQQVATSGKE